MLASGTTAGEEEAQAGGSPAAESDPLVRNGLGSPLCSLVPQGEGALTAASRQNCELSDFVGSPASTGNFGLDVHIDTGFLGLSSAELLVIVQNLFVAPLWMALVWAVHALVVMLEWCFELDLLDQGSLRGGVGSSLRAIQGAITVPWLALALAIGGALCAYHGLVRRRVAESLGQALLALAMTAISVWLTIDPAGTVGALGAFANQASVGTLAVSARGTPAHSGATLAEGFGGLFATAIEVPWCYLEFGDVDWCSSPARLDSGLRSAALALARSELKESGCAQPQAGACSGSQAQALERSARLLRAARSNGEIFLALPPNGPGRNSINDPGSLLRAICRNDNATDCRGPAAAEAEFRTNRGTWPRVGGLLLIFAGVLGLLLLLGFVALRLLGAALFGLLYLMLAPAVALAPVLGETGRNVFRKWAASLLAAVVSKLLYAFLLGIVLALLALLGHLQGLGWWTRWLLLSTFWWGTFWRRHQILQLAGGERAVVPRARGAALLRRSSLVAPVRRLEQVRASRERARGNASELNVQGRRSPHYPPVRVGDASASRAAAAEPRSETAAGEPISSDPRISVQPAAKRGPGTASPAVDDPVGAGDPARRERLADMRERALAVGSARRAARLGSRLSAPEAAAGRGVKPELSARAPGAEVSEREARFGRFLDAQARLPAGQGAAADATGGSRRSYAALSGLAGYGPREYRRLDSASRQAARTAIDRELAVRREAISARQIAAPAVRRGGRHGPASPEKNPQESASLTPLLPPRFDPWLEGRRPGPPDPSKSRVMRDAMEIMARRRRQLREGEE